MDGANGISYNGAYGIDHGADCESEDGMDHNDKSKDEIDHDGKVHMV